MNRLTFTLALSLAAPAAIAQCTIQAPGTQITPTPVDGWTAIQPIGFAFSFAGTTYTDLYITDHGMVALSNAGTPAAPPGGAFVWNPATGSLVVNGPVITPYWSDQTAVDGSIWIDNTSGTSCTVTWLNHHTYFNQQPAFTEQLQIFSDGHIEMRLDSRVNNSGSTFGALNAIVGMSPGTPAVLPGASDISVGVSTVDNTFFEEFVTTGAATPNPLFDLADKVVRCFPTNPGWNVTTEPLPTIAAPGTQISPTPVDAFSALQPIGFAFPFNGTTYSDLYISDHGIVALSNAGVPASPGNGAFTWTVTSASLAAGGPKIAAYWSDANCNTTNAPNAGVFIDNTSGSHCTVTWRDSETYFNQRPPFSTQMTLFADGHVTISLEDRVTNAGSSFDLDAVIGMGNGVATPLPAASDLSLGAVTASPTVFEQWTTTAPGTPNPLFDVRDRTLSFFPTSPGWIVTNDALGCASKQTYGTGCNGLTIDSNNPILGSNWNLTTTGIDPISPISITFFGPAFISGLPMPAIGIPAPGCSIYLGSVLTNLSAPNVLGTSVLSIALPLNATLKGASLSAQSLCLTLANPAFLSTSNGVEGIVGY